MEPGGTAPTLVPRCNAHARAPASRTTGDTPVLVRQRCDPYLSSSAPMPGGLYMREEVGELVTRSRRTGVPKVRSRSPD